MRDGTDPTTTAQVAPTAPAAVVARDVALAHGSHLALAPATFTIPTGAVTALIGPNGAGKSTLLHALAGLLDPRDGHLEVRAPRPAGVAYVLQGTHAAAHVPLTVREVVTMGRYAITGPWRRLRLEDRRLVDAALETLGLTAIAGRPLHELSGGERQRAYVAQGLAQDAELLLLDEPITGLDVVSRHHILEAIAAERTKGRAVVVSTHDLGDAAAADHLLLLAGRVVAEGPADQVLTEAHLADAYGGHFLRVGGRTLILDDHAHH
jgi:manganese transport system ATP-binding protein